MNDIEAAKIIALLQVAYPFPPLTDERHQFYTTKLRTQDFQATTKAVDILTDNEKVERFPTAAQLKRAIDAATPIAPALPAGNPTGQPKRHIFRVFDIDVDDYVDLPTPIPDTDPRYDDVMAASREAVHEAGRRDREQKERAA